MEIHRIVEMKGWNSRFFQGRDSQKSSLTDNAWKISNYFSGWEWGHWEEEEAFRQKNFQTEEQFELVQVVMRWIIKRNAIKSIYKVILVSIQKNFDCLLYAILLL